MPACKRSFIRLVLPGLAAVLIASQGSAQDLAAICQVDRAWATDVSGLTDDLRRVHPATLLDGTRALLDAGEWGAAMAVVSRSFGRSASALGVPTADSLILGSALELAADRLARYTEADRRTLAGERTRRFRPDYAMGEVTIRPDPARPPILLTRATPANRARALCWHAIAADSVYYAYRALADSIAEAALATAVDRWDSFNENGYSQYPWELLLNGGWTFEDGIDPPRFQAIVLHPGVGVEAVGERFESLQRNDVVMVEPIGMLVYNDSRSAYWGASGVLTLPATGGPGGGFLIHFGPWVRAGYVWRFDSEQQGRDGVVLTADLYKWLAGVPEQYENAKARLEKLLPLR